MLTYDYDDHNKMIIIRIINIKICICQMNRKYSLLREKTVRSKDKLILLSQQ